MSSLLEARGISVSRGRNLVLRETSLNLSPGESVAVVGPNAAGKSTLVRALAGLLPVQEGKVLLKGRPLASWARDAVARSVALVTPEEGGPEALTVEDRVALGRYPHRGPFRPLADEDHEIVRQALDRAGVLHLARRRLGTLSAGERQLAALARGLAQEPEALLLDEPAAHLDIGHQLRLFRVLDEIRAAGVAVLAVVHDLQRAAAWAERMALVAGGRVVCEGSPSDVLASPEAEVAFDVTIHGHDLPRPGQRLYRFDERQG